jgi:hypothetical protein
MTAASARLHALFMASPLPNDTPSRPSAPQTGRLLRGASVFRKAFHNYRGDPRALVYYTVNRWNIAGVRTIAALCADNGLPLTFNLYSPTETFLEKLLRGQDNDDDFFRVSRPDGAPVMCGEDLMARAPACGGTPDASPLRATGPRRDGGDELDFGGD